MNLRPYQERAVQALFDYFARADGHPLIDAPTGSGKSVIIAEFIRRAIDLYPRTRVMMLTHVKELVDQNHTRLVDLWTDGDPPVGIYSAGLGRRDIEDQIIFAGIQSAYRCARDFGHRDLILIDEAHRLPKKGAGMYRALLEELTEINPSVKVVGFTATPYRLDGGYLHAGDDRLFTDVAFSIPVGQLVAEGHLSRVVAREPDQGQIDTDDVATRGGDFVAADLERAALASNVRLAVKEMVTIGTARGLRSWLVFACGVDHAHEIVGLLEAEHGIEARTVLGSTSSADREATIADFVGGRLRCLVNVGVLTTGFDAPAVDLLAMMRPTQSTSLYVQIVGRGTRTAPGKEKCLVLDYGGNVRRHGPIDNVAPKIAGKGGAAPVKECPSCGCLLACGKRECDDCGYLFELEQREATHDATADTLAVMSFGPPDVEWDPPREVKVYEVTFERHTKEGKPPSMRVTYLHAAGAVSEWLCFEHGGYATEKAHETWLALGGSEVLPETTDEALERSCNLLQPSRITIKREGKYDRVMARDVSEPLEPSGNAWGSSETSSWGDLDEVPF